MGEFALLDVREVGPSVNARQRRASWRERAFTATWPFGVPGRLSAACVTARRLQPG